MNGNHYNVDDMRKEFERGKKQGAIEELKKIKDLLRVSIDEAVNGEDIAIDVYFEQLTDYIEKRLKELGK